MEISDLSYYYYKHSNGIIPPDEYLFLEAAIFMDKFPNINMYEKYLMLKNKHWLKSNNPEVYEYRIKKGLLDYENIKNIAKGVKYFRNPNNLNWNVVLV